MDLDDICAQKALSKKFPRKRCLSNDIPAPAPTPVIVRFDPVRTVTETPRNCRFPQDEVLHRLRPLSPSNLDEYHSPEVSHSVIMLNKHYDNAVESPRVAPYRKRCHKKIWVQKSLSPPLSPHYRIDHDDRSSQSSVSDVDCPQDLTVASDDSGPTCLMTVSTAITEASSADLTDFRTSRKPRPSPVWQQEKSDRRKPNLRTIAMRQRNAFQSAHLELLGELSPGHNDRQSPLLGEPPQLIRIQGEFSRDDDDSYSEADGSWADTDEDSWQFDGKSDQTSLSIDEMLDDIHIPELTAYTPEADRTNDVIDPYYVGHVNHLIKCYMDAVLMVELPTSVMESKSCTASDYFDIHMAGVLQVYVMMHKSGDFTELSLVDQITLLQSGMLPALISLGFPLYNPENGNWSIPTFLGDNAPFSFAIYNLLQILPKPVVMRTVRMQEIGHKLHIDWTMSILLMFIFIFTPINRSIEDMDKVNVLRDVYVKILYSYIKWRHGSRNAVLLFPEILKFMDVILKDCRDIEEFQLWLKDEEIDALNARMKALPLHRSKVFGQQADVCNKLLQSTSPFDHISFSKIHSRLSSLLLHTFIASETSTSPHPPDEILRTYESPNNIIST